MKEHYFLLDGVQNWPHGGLYVQRFGLDKKLGTPVDHYLSHFEEFSYNNFYNTSKAEILDPKAYKFILQFIHMPANVEFLLTANAKHLLQTDPKAFLILFSVLESQISPEELAKFCVKTKIPFNKVIVLCSNVKAHGQKINGIKYICINFWESVTRHHHQLLPDTFIATKRKRQSSIEGAKKKFLCLNRNVKPHRIWFMYAMIKAEILDQGHVSYHLPKINEGDYNMLSNGHWVLKRIPQHLHKDFKRTNKTHMWPRMLDQLDNETIIQYHTRSQAYFNDSLLSFITESEASDNFLTEKTYKAIANMHPFFIIGNPDQHAILRARGYITFEHLFGANQVTDFDEAMKMLDHVKALDMNVLKRSLHKNYLDKLIHNYNNFFTRRISWQNIVQEIFDATERR